MREGSGKSPGEGNGNPLQYSCLENSTGRGALRATVQGVAKSWTQLSDYYFHFHFLVNTFIGLTKKFIWVFMYHVMQKKNELFVQPNICIMFTLTLCL